MVALTYSSVRPQPIKLNSKLDCMKQPVTFNRVHSVNADMCLTLNPCLPLTSTTSKRRYKFLHPVNFPSPFADTTCPYLLAPTMVSSGVCLVSSSSTQLTFTFSTFEKQAPITLSATAESTWPDNQSSVGHQKPHMRLLTSISHFIRTSSLLNSEASDLKNESPSSSSFNTTRLHSLFDPSGEDSHEIDTCSEGRDALRLVAPCELRCRLKSFDFSEKNPLDKQQNITKYTGTVLPHYQVVLCRLSTTAKEPDMTMRQALVFNRLDHTCCLRLSTKDGRGAGQPVATTSRPFKARRESRLGEARLRPSPLEPIHHPETHLLYFQVNGTFNLGRTHP